MLLGENACYDQYILLEKTLLAFVLLHFVLQGQTYLLLQVNDRVNRGTRMEGYNIISSFVSRVTRRGYFGDLPL